MQKKYWGIAGAFGAVLMLAAYFGRSMEPARRAAPAARPPSLQQQQPTGSKASRIPDRPTSGDVPLRSLDAATALFVSSVQLLTGEKWTAGEIDQQFRDAEEEREHCGETRDRRQARYDAELAQIAAARAAEPRDEAWAYSMEQRVRQYLAGRKESGQFELLSVECKSSFCELTAGKIEPDWQAAFERAIGDFPSPDPRTMVGHEFHRHATDAIFHYVLILQWRQYSELQRRAQAAAERQTAPTAAQQQADAACEAWRAQRSRQAEEAKAAETKDVGWAGPTEQLVRQYIESQIVKHPLERFEIDCRTTYCSITALGTTTQSQEAFNKAAQEVAEEPWSTFRVTEVGGGSTSDGKGWKAHGTYTRRRH